MNKIIKRWSINCYQVCHANSSINGWRCIQTTSSTKWGWGEMMDMRRQGAEGNMVKNRKRQRDGGDPSATGERRQNRFPLWNVLQRKQWRAILEFIIYSKYIRNSTNRKWVFPNWVLFVKYKLIQWFCNMWRIDQNSYNIIGMLFRVKMLFSHCHMSLAFGPCRIIFYPYLTFNVATRSSGS